MKIIFAGTPDFAKKHLQALIDDGKHEIVAVYTQPDRPAGRGKKLTPSAVKELALKHDIPIEQPANFRAEEDKEILRQYNCDLMVVVAYGLLLPKAVLDAPKYGCINVHGSILPKWRGAAPIQRSIWAGDTKSGVTIMQLDEGMDTGDILLIDEIKLDTKETSATLYDKLANIGPTSLIKVIDQIGNKSVNPIKQNDDLATHAKKLTKEEAKIDWNTDAEFIERCIRAFNPWPISYFEHAQGNIKVHQSSVVEYQGDKPAGTILSADKNGILVATKIGAINLEILQIPNKKPMQVNDLLNSRKDWFIVDQIL